MSRPLALKTLIGPYIDRKLAKKVLATWDEGPWMPGQRRAVNRCGFQAAKASPNNSAS
jgi:hypothetical protein